MKIEDLTVDHIEKSADAAELRDFKKRIYALYHKHYVEGRRDSPVPYNRLLDLYESVTKRLNDIWSRGRRRDKTDLDAALSSRRMLGLDTQSLDAVTVVDGAMAVVGKQVADSMNAEDVEVRIAPELIEWEGADESLKKALINVGVMTGKPGDMTGFEDDADQQVIYLYDLKLVPRDRAARSVRKGTAATPEPLPIPNTGESEKTAKRFEVFWKAEEEHIVGGVVYAPDEVDAQGDFTTAEEITKAMYGWMEDAQTMKEMHAGRPKQVKVLECFQPEQDIIKFGNTIKAGAWWLLVRVLDDKIWKRVKKGELTGFSMSGQANVSEAT